MRHPRRTIGIFTATTILLVALEAGSIGISSSMAATKAAAPTWATYDAKTKTAHLTLISSYGSDTYNYNGGKAGHFTFTVPAGAKVAVTYSNNSTMMPHGAEVVAWTGRSQPLSFHPRRLSRAHSRQTTGTARPTASLRRSRSWRIRRASTC